ncbi:FUSC family protein, partial [Cellulomonas triticagri]
MTTSAPSGAQRAISWSWARLGLGVVQAIPATLVVPHDPVAGLALAVGVLPAAAAGLAVRRRARRGLLLVGGVAAVALVLGAVSAAVSAVLAVVVLVGLCLASGSATTRLPRPVAALVTGLGLALVGAGFSLDPGAALAAGGLIVVGSAYSWLVTLAWPDTAAPAPGAPAAVPAPAPDPGAARRYGRQLAVVGGLAATAGLASGVD